ncbi:hypothetical protein [Desulfofustis glycolicus]|uniref:Uncharacterized protein n=1 Tax=Desulfofustis glycolicus DSM 9705 TaxID=1121409 RepID=A0A1M5TNJ7_9BACT|nr:hypothetical protein [Desulfofustis glycolicus]MCB2216507.1 hypothetical protein [Desulfobulbaceae bacterium]SHH52250.1 hypothetical protein SAMN02745124_00822 [Desulfofustis glycolicus DSM 9705]
MSTQKETVVPTTDGAAAPDSLGRRKAVKTLIAGAGALAAYHVLPAKWSKPFIGSIFVPAHAATSGPAALTLNDPCTIVLLRGDRSSDTNDVRVEGFVTPATPGLAVSIETHAYMGPGNTLPAPGFTNNTTTDAAGTFSVTVTVLGGPGKYSIGAVTTVTGASGSASCFVTVPETTTTAPPTTTGTSTTSSTPPPSTTVV